MYGKNCINAKHTETIAYSTCIIVDIEENFERYIFYNKNIIGLKNFLKKEIFLR